jgi:uncharacterized membrane protein YcaP (DUF421 family)
MDVILRVATIYFILMVVMRLSGKRTLAQTTPFDFVLLLIISETTQEALIGGDHSVTQAAIAIVTFVAIDVALSLVKQRSERIARFIEGSPVLLLVDGEPIAERMDRCRIDENDILEAARLNHGLKRLDQIQYAVLERCGQISIIPRSSQPD